MYVPDGSCDTLSMRTRDVLTRNPTFCDEKPPPAVGASSSRASYSGLGSPAATASVLIWVARPCSAARLLISITPTMSGERISVRIAIAAFCVRVTSPAKFSMLKPPIVYSPAAGTGTGTPIMLALAVGVTSGSSL